MQIIELLRKLAQLKDVASQVGPILFAIQDQIEILISSSSTFEQRVATLSKLFSLTIQLREIVKPVLTGSPNVVYSTGPNEEAELKLALYEYAWEEGDDLAGHTYGARGERIGNLIKKIRENPQWIQILLPLFI